MPNVENLATLDTPRSLRSLKAGVSLGDVARGVDAHVTHISRIFNGRRRPSMQMAMRIAQFLDVSVDDLFTVLSEASATTPTVRPKAA